MDQDRVVLLVGDSPILRLCCDRLCAQGIRNFVHLKCPGDSDWNPVDANMKTLEGQNPLNYIRQNPNQILEASLVITCNVPRPVEEALGEIIYNAPPRALIISRCDGFNVKMRSAYKKHAVTDEPGNIIVSGIPLKPHPEPPTPEKMERVLTKLRDAVNLRDEKIQQYMLLLASSSAVLKSSNEQLPPNGMLLASGSVVYEEANRLAVERNLAVGLNEADLLVCCKEGWSALPMTTTLMSAMMSAEGFGLLHSTGRPINACPLDLMACAALGIQVDY